MPLCVLRGRPPGSRLSRRLSRWGCLALLAAALTGVVGACRPIQGAAAGEAASEAAGGAAGGAAGEVVAVAVARPSDRATVAAADGRLRIDLYSPGGIGAATVTWLAAPDAPPVLRLHLGGLEELRLTHAGGEIVATVASSPPHTVRQSAAAPGNGEAAPQSVTAADPAWLEITWSSGAADAAFPLPAGYFDVVLRDRRLTQPGTSLQIQWIDFFR